MRNAGIRPDIETREAAPSIVRPGQNAWRGARADRLCFLVDGQAYFQALTRALDGARRQIWIIGWDFNPDIRIDPDDPDSPTLGAFLHRLVQTYPDLTIRILVWAMGPIYSGKSLRMFRKRWWSSHPRIRLAFDNRHPIRASHHQKFVVIDDAVAFVGGIDLTAKRWDTTDHAVQDTRRAKPSGELYEPVHDLQMAMEGEAARAAGDLARRRWTFATDEVVAPCGEVRTDTAVIREPDMEGCSVAFARTEPAYRGRESCREAMDLTLDALKTARRQVYIESQYFASEAVCDILCDKLADPDGPEVVVLSTLSSHGLIERLVLGANRDRMVRRLLRCDRHRRVRAFYPVVPKPDGGEQEIIIHSKLVIVDDRFLRIGSSNLNQRSVAMDTELDVAVEARSTAERAAVMALRDRLLAEHLDVPAERFAEVVRSETSLVRAIDRLNVGARGLRNFAEADAPGPVTLAIGTSIVDPVEPWWPLSSVRASLAGFFRSQLRRAGSSAASLEPSTASLVRSETSPSGRGMKK